MKQEKYQSFSDQVCKDQGIDDFYHPNIEFKSSDELKDLGEKLGADSESCRDGFYDPNDNKIYLPDDRSNEETMNTIAHEARHCYQHECVAGRGNQSDPNIDKYKESFAAKDEGKIINEQQNTDLFTEQDARNFADSYSEKLDHTYRSNDINTVDNDFNISDSRDRLLEENNNILSINQDDQTDGNILSQNNNISQAGYANLNESSIGNQSSSIATGKEMEMY